MCFHSFFEDRSLGREALGGQVGGLEASWRQLGSILEDPNRSQAGPGCSQLLPGCPRCSQAAGWLGGGIPWGTPNPMFLPRGWYQVLSRGATTTSNQAAGYKDKPLSCKATNMEAYTACQLKDEHYRR